MRHEVVIIGGGFAGLSAGVVLAGAGWRVRLLEEKPYLGGRARSFRDSATGSVVDNGQHIFMGCYHSTIRFLKTLGTLDRIRFQPRLQVNFLDLRRRRTALVCPDLPSPWHLFFGVMSSRSFSLKEKVQVLRLGRALGSGKRRGDGQEAMTVSEWLTRHKQSRNLQRNFWDLLCIAAMNEDPRVASAALFERVLRLALLTSPTDSRLGIAQAGLSDCYVREAATYIEARGGSVETGCSVSQILINGTVCEGVELADGKKQGVSVVVSAVPWYQFANLMPKEVLDKEPYFFGASALRPAPIISINLWFDRQVTDLDFVGLRGTTMQWLFNKGRIFGAGGSYISLVLSGAHQHVARTKEELLALALSDLRALLPEMREAKLLHSLVLKERYATFSPTSEAEPLRPGARTPVRGLYLAGDWTDTGLPATIEGAVQSGYAAAEAVMDQG
jgi:squalene-associated FAD-dependent desaturase